MLSGDAISHGHERCNFLLQFYHKYCLLIMFLILNNQVMVYLKNKDKKYFFEVRIPRGP